MDRFSIAKGEDPPPERIDMNRESKPQTPKVSMHVPPGVYIPNQWQTPIGHQSGSLIQPDFFQTFQNDTHSTMAARELVLIRGDNPESAIRIFPTSLSFSGDVGPLNEVIYTINLSFQLDTNQLNILTGRS